MPQVSKIYAIGIVNPGAFSSISLKIFTFSLFLTFKMSTIENGDIGEATEGNGRDASFLGNL